MKNLLFRFMLILSFAKISISSNEPEFTLALEYIGYCKDIRDKGIITLENFNLWSNHTSSGYIDILEDIPSTSTISLIVHFQVNNTWSSSSLSTKKESFCKFIEKDIWFVPIVRMVSNIPERCPFRKTHIVLKSVMLYKRKRGVFPVGCMKIDIIITYKDKMLAGLSLVVKLLYYAQRFENICIEP